MFWISPNDCGEDDPTCRELGSEVVCKAPLLDFAKRRCRIFCEFCFVNTTDNNTLGTEMTPPPASKSTTVAFQRAPTQIITLTARITATARTPLSAVATHQSFVTSTMVSYQCSPGYRRCEWEIWGAWSSCSAPCGAGTSIRSRSLCCDLARETLSECVKSCNVAEDTVENIPCNGDCAVAGTTYMCSKADVVFVIDSSVNNGAENFQKVKHFLQNMINKLQIDIDHVRVGALVFTDQSRWAFKLGDITDKLDMLKAVERIPYTMSGPIMSDAFEVVRNEGFKSNRQGVPKIVLLITDSQSRYPAIASFQASLLRKSDIQIYVVGIGYNSNAAELTNLASDPHEKYINVFAGINSLDATNVTLRCNGSDTTTLICKDVRNDCANFGPDVCSSYRQWAETFCAFTCGFCRACAAKALDVVFVVDSSGSIGIQNYQKIKTFIKDVIRTFDIGPRTTRVALIEFSTTPRIEFTLNEKHSLFDLLAAVDNLTYTGGGTATSDALHLMRTQGFQNEDPHALDIAVVITDGLSKLPEMTRSEANYSKEEGITMFAIGIGNMTDKAELQAIATDKWSLYEVQDYDTLLTLANEIAHHVCSEKQENSVTQIVTQKPETLSTMLVTQKQETTTAPLTSKDYLSTTTASCIAKVADVVFVVDSSGSIGKENFQKIKEFIKDVIKTFDVDPRHTRVGLIEFSTVPKIEFKLNEKTNITDLLEAVDNITYSGGGTATSDALYLMRTEGFDRERPDAPDIAIVITDGLSKFPTITKSEANYAKAEEITMFSIGIGNLTDKDELLAIASDKRFLFEVADYETLLTLDSVIAHRACGIELPEDHHTRSATTTSTTPSGCVDLSPDCGSYPRDSCTDFEPYARKNCAKTCGYCPGFPLVEPKCEDTINNCEQYGTSMCYDTVQYSWVEAHCSKFCGFCGNKTDLFITTTVPTTVKTTSSIVCENKLANCESYNKDQCTNPTFTSWARGNCAKYCGFCYNYNYVTSAVVNQISCPAWALPEQCTLEYKAGQCCPFPKCPDGFQLTVERHL